MPRERILHQTTQGEGQANRWNRAEVLATSGLQAIVWLLHQLQVLPLSLLLYAMRLQLFRVVAQFILTVPLKFGRLASTTRV